MRGKRGREHLLELSGGNLTAPRASCGTIASSVGWRRGTVNSNSVTGGYDVVLQRVVRHQQRRYEMPAPGPAADLDREKLCLELRCSSPRQLARESRRQALWSEAADVESLSARRTIHGNSGNAARGGPASLDRGCPWRAANSRPAEPRGFRAARSHRPPQVNAVHTRPVEKNPGESVTAAEAL